MNYGVQLTAAGDGRFEVLVDGNVRGHLRESGDGVLWMPLFAHYTLRLSWGEFARLTRPC